MSRRRKTSSLTLMERLIWYTNTYLKDKTVSNPEKVPHKKEKKFHNLDKEIILEMDFEGDRWV
jgi:hypothetical protein